MPNLGDQSFLPTNLGRVDEEMVPAVSLPPRRVIMQPPQGGALYSLRSAGLEPLTLQKQPVLCAFVAWGTLNSRRAARPLVRLVEGEEGWEILDPPPGCSFSKLGWNRAKSYCHLYGAQNYG
ncbi:hypothetical protein TNCV_4853451 [Trichonephila clavipes]|nr:hypothetical protein TNCV_4853451 [Trichonephila clavipes]